MLRVLSRQFLATMTAHSANLTAGPLAGQSRELLGFMNLQETQGFGPSTIASLEHHRD